MVRGTQPVGIGDCEIAYGERCEAEPDDDCYAAANPCSVHMNSYAFSLKEKSMGVWPVLRPGTRCACDRNLCGSLSKEYELTPTSKTFEPVADMRPLLHAR